MQSGFDRVWRWRKNLPERHGQLCRILARGAMNSAQIEFEDGVKHIVSRFAIRRAPIEAIDGAPRIGPQSGHGEG